MPRSNGGKPRLLILDNPRSRKLFETVLGDSYDVVYADDPEEALKLIPQQNPDLVLLNHSLASTDGLSVARRIRDGEASSVPILLLVNGDRPTIRKQAEKSGCNGCVSKPIDPKKLLEQVEGALISRNGSKM